MKAATAAIFLRGSSRPVYVYRMAFCKKNGVVHAHTIQHWLRAHFRLAFFRRLRLPTLRENVSFTWSISNSFSVMAGVAACIQLCCHCSKGVCICGSPCLPIHSNSGPSGPTPSQPQFPLPPLPLFWECSMELSPVHIGTA